MNEQLIKFIELCLMDGVVTDKEREVIFRKSKELSVPEDECEIILEGLIQQKGGVSEVNQNQTSPTNPIQEVKKNIEFKFNNLNNSQKINSELDELKQNLSNKKLKQKEINQKFNQIIGDFKGQNVGEISGITFDYVYNSNDNFEGGKHINSLISILKISNSYLKKIDNSNFEEILFYISINFNLQEYLVIFKRTENIIWRYMIKKKDFKELGLKIPKDLNYREGYGRVKEMVKKYYSDFLENRSILEPTRKKIDSQHTELFSVDKLIDEFNKTLNLFDRGVWKGEIINPEKLEVEITLLNLLTVKTTIDN